eukprot:SAG25_NODE_8991_length_393_cov_0.870748_1_plen_42_part_01
MATHFSSLIGRRAAIAILISCSLNGDFPDGSYVLKKVEMATR